MDKAGKKHGWRYQVCQSCEGDSVLASVIDSLAIFIPTRAALVQVWVLSTEVGGCGINPWSGEAGGGDMEGMRYFTCKASYLPRLYGPASMFGVERFFFFWKL